MKIVVSKHARQEIERRRLDLEKVMDTAANPEQVVPERGGRLCGQSRVSGPGGRIYLLRVILEDRESERLVVTAYATSKVEKYWRPS